MDGFIRELWEQGLSLPQLKHAWDLIKPMPDWKAQVNCDVLINSDGEKRAIKVAVEWFTATTPTIERVSEYENVYRVKADGYRRGPAGDH